MVSSRLPKILYHVLHGLPASGTSNATSPSLIGSCIVVGDVNVGWGDLGSCNSRLERSVEALVRTLVQYDEFEMEKRAQEER